MIHTEYMLIDDSTDIEYGSATEAMTSDAELIGKVVLSLGDGDNLIILDGRREDLRRALAVALSKLNAPLFRPQVQVFDGTDGAPLVGPAVTSPQMAWHWLANQQIERESDGGDPSLSSIVNVFESLGNDTLNGYDVIQLAGDSFRGVEVGTDTGSWNNMPNKIITLWNGYLAEHTVTKEA